MADDVATVVALDIAELREPHLVLVGYSGRDQAAVQAHVDELLRHGVPAPTKVPAIWEVPASLLSQQPDLVVRTDGTSGEAEPVIVVHGGRHYLTVGSDHTDRDLERIDMDEAKAACSKVLAPECWPLPGDDTWDAIGLRSEIEVDGLWQLYQEATLASLLPPSWYLSRFVGEAPTTDTVIFCGTVATVGDLVTDATAFRATLTDAAGGRSLVCEYRIKRGD
ncbi:MAG TPA: DUF2848 family protein [Acidimicrobiales bacterium]|nr:DUF2848 family protein [Acidimicrobiales bacterium]